MRIVEPIPYPASIPPVERGLGGYGSSSKDAGGFFVHFQEADRASRTPRAITRRKERQRMEAENSLYPDPIFGTATGPHH